jgi:hypothetical protein
MKKPALFVFMIISITSHAQNYPGMNEADMQKMMQHMEKMQSCMEKVDQSELKALEQRSKKMESEIKSLCASGKRDKAQQEAIAFGKEIANDPSIKIMMKCGEIMKDAMPQISFKGVDSEHTNVHVCD